MFSCRNKKKYQYFLDENAPSLEQCYLFSGTRLGNRTSGERNNRQHLQLHRRACCRIYLQLASLHQTSPIQQIELNESTDIDVDQSIEDLVSQSISSSTETHTNLFFMKGDFWPSCIPLSVVRPCVNISIKTFLLLLAHCSALKRE